VPGLRDRLGLPQRWTEQPTGTEHLEDGIGRASDRYVQPDGAFTDADVPLPEVLGGVQQLARAVVAGLDSGQLGDVTR